MEHGAVSFMLPGGGSFRVTSDSWSITYYITPLDRRHKTETVTYNSESINEFISALKRNFKEFERLKSAPGSVTDLYIKGDGGMTISLTDWSKGVSVKGLHQAIATHSQLDEVLHGLYAAVGSAPRIQAFLHQIAREFPSRR